MITVLYCPLGARSTDSPDHPWAVHIDGRPVAVFKTEAAADDVRRQMLKLRQTRRVTDALRLVDAGMTPYRAARTMNIALSTIYRALLRRRRVLEPR